MNYLINEAGQVLQVEKGKLSDGSDFEIQTPLGMQKEIQSAKVGNTVTYQWVKFSLTDGVYQPDTTNTDVISVIMPDGQMHNFTPILGKIDVDITQFSQPPVPVTTALQQQNAEIVLALVNGGLM